MKLSIKPGKHNTNADSLSRIQIQNLDNESLNVCHVTKNADTYQDF